MKTSVVSGPVMWEGWVITRKERISLRNKRIEAKCNTKLLGEGKGKLWTTIRDDFIVESKAEVYFVEKEGGYPLAVMVVFVGQRITSLVRPWLTTTSHKSKPEETERLMMTSQEISWKGCEVWDLIGVSGGMVRCVLDLFCWNVI